MTNYINKVHQQEMNFQTIILLNYKIFSISHTRINYGNLLCTSYALNSENSSKNLQS